jgi:hypothetical protein
MNTLLAFSDISYDTKQILTSSDNGLTIALDESVPGWNSAVVAALASGQQLGKSFRFSCCLFCVFNRDTANSPTGDIAIRLNSFFTPDGHDPNLRHDLVLKDGTNQLYNDTYLTGEFAFRDGRWQMFYVSLSSVSSDENNAAQPTQYYFDKPTDGSSNGATGKLYWKYTAESGAIADGEVSIIGVRVAIKCAD